MDSPYDLPYYLHGAQRSTDMGQVLRTAGPLLLAIAGSALVPLPCAFGQMGIPAGTVFLLLVAAANDYTTVLLVRAAVKLRVSSYEEVVLSTMGPAGLLATRASLVLLLFGTLCGNLAAVQESAARAAELAGWPWLGATAGGRAALLGVPTVLVVLPLATLNLGEMAGMSLVGCAIMFACAGYLLYYAIAAGALTGGLAPYEVEGRLSALPQAISTLGYAFYVQPCALPMLSKLPPGEEGARVLELALHLTFAITAAAAWPKWPSWERPSSPPRPPQLIAPGSRLLSTPRRSRRAKKRALKGWHAATRPAQSWPFPCV